MNRLLTNQLPVQLREILSQIVTEIARYCSIPLKELSLPAVAQFAQENSTFLVVQIRTAPISGYNCEQLIYAFKCDFCELYWVDLRPLTANSNVVGFSLRGRPNSAEMQAFRHFVAALASDGPFFSHACICATCRKKTWCKQWAAAAIALQRRG